MQEDKIIQKLFEHDNEFKGLKSEIGDFKHETLHNQEEMITILKRLDDERIFTMEWVKRIETGVEEDREKIRQHGEEIN